MRDGDARPVDARRDAARKREPPADPREAALVWFARLRAEDVTPQERREFAAWRGADPAHGRAYGELDALWATLDRVPRPAPAAPRVSASRGFSRRLVLQGGLGIAAAAAVALVLDLPARLEADHRTTTGEIRTLALPDGSRMTLDADSAVAVAFGPERRTVRLLHGRAFFAVAADPQRPFAVGAAGGDAVALGTAFSVDLWEGATTVAVTEHAVRVTAPAGATVEVGAGAQVRYGPNGLEPVTATPAGGDAWRSGRLIFTDQPLSRVVADINRYRPGRIVVGNAGLDGLRVSGTFDLRRPEAILEAVLATLPVRATWFTRYLVLLQPA